MCADTPKNPAPHPRRCPECHGTGCDPEPLQAPADGTSYLVPRCSLCRGKGTISEEQQRRYLSRQR